MEPIFTNEAVVLGLLIVVLGAVFFTEKLESKGWKRFYTFVPSLLLCYFIPALLHYPLGLIAPHYFEQEPLEAVLKAAEIAPPEGWGSWTYEAVKTWLEEKPIWKNRPIWPQLSIPICTLWLPDISCPLV